MEGSAGLSLAMGLAQVGAVLAAAVWQVPTGELSVEGKATHYGPGLMGEVARNRGVSLDGFAGGVALNRAGDLGRKVWLEWDPSTSSGRGEGLVDGPFLVVDCAGRGQDYVRRERQGYVVEVSERVALARGFAWVGPVGVRVWFVDPRMEEWGAY